MVSPRFTPFEPPANCYKTTTGGGWRLEAEVRGVKDQGPGVAGDAREAGARGPGGQARLRPGEVTRGLGDVAMELGMELMVIHKDKEM